MVSKDLWQVYKEHQCRDMEQDREVWLWRSVRQSGTGQLWPGLGLFSISTMQRLAETSNQANRAFIVMYAVSLHKAVPHPPARPLSVRKTITSH